MAQAKVGFESERHDVKNGQLLPAIRAVITDEQVISNARDLAAEFAALGGAKRAAELIAEKAR
ncbi:MAG: hypothetical protein U0528_09545 [Anaerolineae bacterium]